MYTEMLCRFLKNSAIIGTTMITGISISFIIVSLFIVKKKGIKKSKDWYIYFSEADSSSSGSDEVSEITKVIDEDLYENKYIEEYSELKDNDLNETLQEKKGVYPFIEETTPRGVVKLSYNSLDNCFIYYTDNNDIPYKYLETIARLYVIKHNCKNIYINYEKELNKLIEKHSKSSESIENEVIDSSSNVQSVDNSSYSIFAKFRKSTSTATTTGGSRGADVTGGDGNGNGNGNGDGSRNKWLIPEKTNKYIFKGKLRTYDEDYPVNENTKSEEININYSSFIKRIGII